ncbi:MAG TPA: hypothetical protein VMJ34_20965 [Bryobacteraceae bacterium]|nr:hypothetical protein [Bryobacteraceae bacterium]
MADNTCTLRFDGIDDEYDILAFTAERSAGLNAIHFQIKTCKGTMHLVNAANAERRVPSATLLLTKGGQTAVHIEFRDLLIKDDMVYATSGGHPVETYKIEAAGMDVIEQIGPLSYGTMLPGKTYRY